MNIVLCASEFLWSRVFRRFPELKIVLAEGGIGWVPYFMERCDRHFQQQAAWTGQDFGGRLPSEVFREHFVTCFVTDQFGVHNRHAIGVENITWEADFPHGDGEWPRGPESLAKMLDGVPDDEVNLITHRNAMRLFRYDPFSVLDPADCTVGALRAQATDVDLSTHAKHKSKIKGTTGIDAADYIKKWAGRHGGDLSNAAPSSS